EDAVVMLITRRCAQNVTSIFLPSLSFVQASHTSPSQLKKFESPSGSTTSFVSLLSVLSLVAHIPFLPICDEDDVEKDYNGLIMQPVDAQPLI
ncbi:hypothetical protein EV361DRAFT_957178, partial [Lentinula raphanica]